MRGEEAQQLNWTANLRWLTEEGRRLYWEALGPAMDVTIVVTPERWQTWTDATMFKGLLDSGYTEEEMAGWFLPPDP